MSSSQPAGSKWMSYTLEHRHERRAALVCTVCHAKKVKCDLQTQQQNGLSQCSFCLKSGRQCQVRSPKRRRRAAAATRPDDHGPSPTKTTTGYPTNAMDVTLPITPPRSNHEMPPPSPYRKISLPSGSQGDAPFAPNSNYANTALPLGAKQPAVPASGPSPQEDFQTQATAAGADHINTGHSCPSEGLKSDVDTGFQQVYAREMSEDAHHQALRARPSQPLLDTSPQTSAELLNIFADTYFDDCYAWCPVLDRETLQDELNRSPILQNALAALGSHVRPPMLPHDGPTVHYDKARRMFYEDEEPDTLACLKAILLFNWWAPRSPAMVHRHSSWWWTSVVIRHAQQMSIHRLSQAPESNTQRSAAWRRVWWTAFARERLTALCQSKPPIINPEDCSIREPSLEDFPLEMRCQTKPLVFIAWVQLCAIIGRIAQLQSRSVTGAPSIVPNPLGPVAEELRAWVGALPPRVSLSLGSRYVSAFDKDTYQLHIPYLAAIIVLNLQHGPEPGALPLALPPAIFAASCMARIFKDILAKGDTRFLVPITSWYCGVSFIAMLAATRDPVLRDAAKADLEIITLMCDQLRKMWASAQVIYGGFDRLRATAESERESAMQQPPMASGNPLLTDTTTASPATTFPTAGTLDWIDYFPFASTETSKIVELLLDLRQKDNYTANAMLCNTSSLDPWGWFNGLINAEFTLDNDLFEDWTGYTT